MKEAIDILRKGWCKGSAARKDGQPIPVEEANASCSFCAWGALIRAYGQREADRILDKAGYKEGRPLMFQFNDEAEDVEQVISYLEALADATDK